jgi:hypothetical protein
MTTRILSLWALACLMAVSPVAAQNPAEAGASRRIAVDTVAGWQDFFGEDADWRAQAILDAFVGVELAPGWQLSVRPIVWRIRGEWDTLLDQASVRYETRRGANWRIEVGLFPSPIGLGVTENRASLNAGILWWHRPYYMPLPSLGADLPRVSLISTVYPWGAQMAASDDHWDARAAVVDRPPVEFWRPTGDTARRPNLIVGGGLSPRQGLRIGAAGARGRYADPAAGRGALDYSTLSAEGDFAFGYTRLSGEWVRSRFHAPGGTRTAEGWTAQAQQTLTPRLFGHSRLTRMRSPRAASSLATVVELQRYWSIDSTLGYLLSPELTLRAAHTAIRAFGRTPLDHQLGLSVVWARRWW